MSDLPEYYSKIRHTDMAALYLARLACDAACDIDIYRQGKSTDFKHAKELSSIIQSYQQNPDKIVPDTVYMSLWRVLRKHTSKELRRPSELALEMRLLSSELEHIPGIETPNRMIELLVDLSKEFHKEHYQSNPPARRMAARPSTITL